MDIDVITVAADTYTKIGDQQGSNPGGWYRKTGTTDTYYLKLYANPDNARMERLANRIYRKLGISVPVSELLRARQGLLFASKKIGLGVRASLEEQQGNTELKRGFVADCYLSNWDVVGEFFDNIVKDENGTLYRVDNGGCGPLRASGELAAFSPSEIKELSDMRNPRFQAGRVFGDLQDSDLIPQATHLIDTLDDEFVEAAVRDSGLSEDIAEITGVGLLGRKKLLTDLIARGALTWQA